MTPTRQEFLHITLPEKVVFYVLIFLSLGAMVWQIWSRSRLWMQGKPIGWKPVGVSAWWTHILAQRKVRSSRRRSGAPMHLMIFYGFVALFVATTILAVNTYGPIKFHQGTFYLWYELVFDFMGLVFVAGAAWALGRRIWFIPKNMANESGDWQAIGLLLLLGVTGFVLEAGRIANAPQPWDSWSFVGFALSKLLGSMSADAYRLIWWFHMVWVAVFFAVLPRLRIRHVVMSIMTSYGSDASHPWGELKSISIEEVEETGQIGVASTKDYSRWHLMSLDACMECGRCTDACPANRSGKLLNPKQVVQDLRRANEHGVAVAEAVSEDVLWACTTCNACVEACPVLIRHVDLIVDARRNLVAEGKFSGTGAGMLRQLASTGHAWGQPGSSREDWMQGMEIQLCRSGDPFDVLFWVGCAGATDPSAVRTTKAFAGLLKKAGVRFACLGNEEACTGDPARRVGDEFLFQDKAAAMVEVFKRYSVRKVVTACPHCLNTLKNEYGQFGADLEVCHHSQMLETLIGEGRIRGAKLLPGSTVLHDPCYLARVNNESDAPRHALGESSNLNGSAFPSSGMRNQPEPENFGRKTLCCGAGGGRMFMEEPPEQRPGVRRAEELLATGATTVAVACPFCRIMLDASVRQITDQNVELVDVAELVAASNLDA